MYIFVLLFISWPLLAHQTSLTSSGKQLFWTNKNVPLMIRTQTSDLNSTEIKNVVRDSMAEWNNSSSAKIVETSSSNNEIKFVSNFPYGSAVLGVTELSYNGSGAIQKAVISLNDDYYFHPTPGLYPSGQVFLGDVVTHEMGHLFGLSHSEVLNSSMFYSSFSGQSSVAFDDKTGIRTKYDNAIYGKITGTVRGGEQIGVLGVHVQAISRKTGEASAVITDEYGYFELGGLDLNDTYYLYTSPTIKPDSLPGKYSNIQSEFCPASYVGSFFNACGRNHDGKPQGINLTTSQTNVDVGIVTINCSLRSDADYDAQKLETSFSPVMIYDYSYDQKHEKAFVGWFRKKTDSSWANPDLLRVDLSSYAGVGSNKYLKVSLVSHSFGAQLEYKMDIEHDSALVASEVKSYSALTETYSPDLEAFIPLSADSNQNLFEIAVSSKRMDSFYLSQTFPAISDFTSATHMPYLLIVSIWEDVGGSLRPIVDTTSNLSDNKACLDAPLTYAVSDARSLNDDSLESTAAQAASCGTIEPPSSGPGSSLPLIILGFMMAMAPSVLSKSRKKFLS